jgi:hypothetical protein
MELPNELNERVLMAIRGVFNEHPQLINEVIIEEINQDIDEVGDYLLNIFGYFDDENGGVDFGEYSLVNRYLTENDEMDITKYVIYYDDFTCYIQYDILQIMRHKINYFMWIYANQCRDIIIDIINDIYETRDIEVGLK